MTTKPTRRRRRRRLPAPRVLRGMARLRSLAAQCRAAGMTRIGTWSWSDNPREAMYAQLAAPAGSEWGL